MIRNLVSALSFEGVFLNEKSPGFVRILSLLAGVIAVVTSLYHVIGAYTGVPESLKHRPVHVALILTLVFLLKGREIEGLRKVGVFDLFFVAALVVPCVYAFINSKRFTTRFLFVAEFSTLDLAMGILLILGIIEAGRRTVGLVLPIISIVSIAYACLGNYLPAPFTHKGFSLPHVIEYLYTTLDGIWGPPIHAMATFVFIFILFGAILTTTGLGKFFSDISEAIAGKYTGGLPKTAVISSALLGMISGSAVANVATTGAFTIPAMKKYGLPGEFAAGVEAAASTGGQFTPPIMGAAAFIMAETTGIPYVTIIKHAVIPACLYYLAVFLQVHFRSDRLGLAGLPPSQIPSKWHILKTQGYLVIPLVLIVWLMFVGYTPARAGLFGILATVLLCLLDSNKRPKIVEMLIVGLKSAPKSIMSVTVACANAGILVGVIGLTGIGLRLTSIIVDFSQGIIMLALLLSMILCIILGMGMSTAGVYIIVGCLLGPALVQLGLLPIQAHMFLLIFAGVSGITPPVAIAAYAGAGIAGCDPMKAGFTAWKLGLAAFIIPFMFAFSPSLLGIGEWYVIAQTVVTASIGILGLAIAVEGWMFARLNGLERVVAFFGAVLLIVPEIVTDIVGLGVLLIIVIKQIIRKRRIVAAETN